MLARPDGAGFKAVDTFNYIFASTVSEDSRQLLASMMSKSGGGGLASMFGIPQMDKEVMAHMEPMSEAVRAGKSAEVLRLYDALPVRFRTERLFFIMRMQALMALSSAGDAKIDEEYKAALRAAPQILGQDSTSDLLMVDLLFLEKDFQGADDCLQRVDKVIGGDPYLTYLRAGARLQMKDYASALALADEAQKAEPTLNEAVDMRISVHLERKDHKAVVQEFRTFRKDQGITLDREALADDENYKDFLTSPEFLAWEKEVAK